MNGTLRFVTALFALLLLAAPNLSAQGEPAGGDEVTPSEIRARYEAIAGDFESRMKAFQDAFAELKTDEERRQHYEENYPDAGAIALPLLALAKEHPQVVGLEAVEWAMDNPVGGPAREAALELLAEHFLSDPRIADMLWNFAYDIDANTGSLLRAVMKTSDDEKTLGIAHYAFAKHLQGQVSFARYYTDAEETEKTQMAEYFGEETIASLTDLDSAAVERECESLFAKIVESYGEIPSMRGSDTLGDIAGRDLFELRNLSVGKQAPEIEGEDLFGSTFKLSDYRGKVIFLDFWGDW
ncbi:MAG: hypothetical protein ACO4CW_03860 [Planctomycetota bacterium]